MPIAAKLPVSGESEPSQPVEVKREKLHLSSRDVPPGGLRYKIIELAERAPRESWVGPFNSIYDLTNEVAKRCKANGIAPPSQADIEDQLCQRAPPGYCRDESNRPTLRPGALSLGLGDVVRGSQALVGFFRHGPVDDDEVRRRTAICNACPENRLIEGCDGCAGNPFRRLMDAIVVRPLPSDAMLGACTICKCGLKAKTRFRLEDLPPLTPEQQARLPESCWIIAPISQRDSDPRI